jgi:glucose-1-phosphate cytidylyltransferase
MAKSKVVLLAGGQGMRLREETEYRPKPMVEVGGRPLLWHIMQHYARYQHKEFVICLGYKGDVIKGYFLNYDYLSSDFTLTLGSRESIVCHDQRDEYGWSITLCNTGQDAQTGSRIKQIEKYVQDAELILLTYGDGVSDVDLDELIKFHRKHGRIATVTGVLPPSRFGELMVDGDKVTTFSEKPQVSKGLINGGFFVLDQRVFNYLSADPSCSFEQEPLQNLALDGQLMMYEHTGFWQCVDTMRDLIHLNQLWNSGQPPWLVLDPVGG